MPALVAYQFTQSSPSDTWIINHNLNVYPIIDVTVSISSVMTRIKPLEVDIIDSNNVRILFTEPFSGQARLI